MYLVVSYFTAVVTSARCLRQSPTVIRTTLDNTWKVQWCVWKRKRGNQIMQWASRERLWIVSISGALVCFVLIIQPSTVGTFRHMSMWAGYRMHTSTCAVTRAFFCLHDPHLPRNLLKRWWWCCCQFSTWSRYVHSHVNPGNSGANITFTCALWQAHSKVINQEWP